MDICVLCVLYSKDKGASRDNKKKKSMERKNEKELKKNPGRRMCFYFLFICLTNLCKLR